MKITAPQYRMLLSLPREARSLKGQDMVVARSLIEKGLAIRVTWEQAPYTGGRPTVVDTLAITARGLEALQR